MHNYLVKNKVPPSAVLNGMQFATKPDFFGLNESESRLLAPRLAFLKLMQVPRGRQFKIHGNVVNVPAEVSETVNMLPRLPSETGTIKVNLKRRLQYKSSALSPNIRPHVCHDKTVRSSIIILWFLFSRNSVDLLA